MSDTDYVCHYCEGDEDRGPLYPRYKTVRTNDGYVTTVTHLVHDTCEEANRGTR